MKNRNRWTRLSVRVLSMALALLLMGSLTVPALTPYPPWQRTKSP